MNDYYSTVNNYSETKLVAEIQRLNNHLGKMNPANSMYVQVLDMLDIATQAYNDTMFTARMKDAKDEIIELGAIESEVIETDYTKDEILSALVEVYSDNPSRKTNE